MSGSTPLLPDAAVRARSVAERYAQGRRNARGLSALAAAHFVLAWAYGDATQQAAFGAAGLVGLAYVGAGARLPERDAHRLGIALAVPAIALLQLAMPPDLRGPALLLPYGLAIFSGMPSARGALLAFLSPWGASLAGDLAGLTPVVDSPVPELASVLTTLTTTLVAATVGMMASHRRTRRARTLIGTYRAALAVEDERLAVDHADLATATLELERETTALERLRAREARLSDELSAKRADERALINAIHQDLREPLRSVVSFGQLITRRVEEAGGGPGVGEYLGYAVDGGRRMAVMLDDLLRYAESTEPGEAEVVDLAAVVAGARRDLHAVVERTGARVDVDAASLPAVYGQSTQLTQLFLNLLNNALKFAHPGRIPEVEVGASPAGPHGVVVTVRDAGIGIPAHQLDKVFGLFNRAHEGDGYEGSGVGLALCRRIAIAHGADLTVESAPGEGTTFSIAFSQVAAPVGRAAPPTPQPSLAC